MPTLPAGRQASTVNHHRKPSGPQIHSISKIIQMKIEIIGSGIVAQVMGRAFLTEGDEIMMGSRNPQKDSIKKWKAENPGAIAGSFAEAASFGELLVLAVAGHAALQALEATGLKSLEGKTI